MTIETARLVLRPWADEDRLLFAEMSADPLTMRYLLPLDGRDASDRWIDRQIAHQAAHGFCFWALTLKQSGTWIGAVGLLNVSYDAPFTPAVEVGWRVSRPHWGQGYAPEAASAALRFGFETLGLPEIVANACVANTSSHRVMEKLGMSRDPADDFEHPRIPQGHELRPQRLYRMPRHRFRDNQPPPPNERTSASS